MWVCSFLCVGTCVRVLVSTEAKDCGVPLELQMDVSFLMWVPEMEPEFSTRVVHTWPWWYRILILALRQVGL